MEGRAGWRASWGPLLYPFNCAAASAPQETTPERGLAPLKGSMSLSECLGLTPHVGAGPSFLLMHTWEPAVMDGSGQGLGSLPQNPQLTPVRHPPLQHSPSTPAHTSELPRCPEHRAQLTPSPWSPPSPSCPRVFAHVTHLGCGDSGALHVPFIGTGLPLSL